MYDPNTNESNSKNSYENKQHYDPTIKEHILSKKPPSREVDKENHDKFSDSEGNKKMKHDVATEKSHSNQGINVGDSSDESGNDVEISKNSKIPIMVIPKYDQNDNPFDFYEYLRKEYSEKKIKWEDPEFPPDINQLYNDPNNIPERLKSISFDFERPEVINQEENDNIKFYFFNNSSNINYQFNIKRGIFNDKFLHKLGLFC